MRDGIRIVPVKSFQQALQSLATLTRLVACRDKVAGKCALFVCASPLHQRAAGHKIAALSGAFERGANAKNG